MQLHDFISAALEQILEGIRKAQAKKDGGHINADGFCSAPAENVFSVGDFGTFTVVKFDLAVSAVCSGKGGANLKVFGVGIEGGGEHRAETANRISFAVPVRLPDGDRERAKKTQEEIQRKIVGGTAPDPRGFV